VFERLKPLSDLKVIPEAKLHANIDQISVLAIGREVYYRKLTPVRVHKNTDVPKGICTPKTKLVSQPGLAAHHRTA